MPIAPAALLVVEDHPSGELLARFFRESNNVVSVCKDGPGALAMIAAQRFDLVLLDINLPGMDGLAVLQSIRAQHAATALPVIMTTGYEHSDIVVRALELGANDYVTKPYDVSVLRARVHTHLSIKRMVEETERLERSLATAYGRMKADLRAAARVQETLLPHAAPRVRGGSFAWAFEPCEELAGDTLNVFDLDADHVGLYLLDVSGHGVAAALLAVQLSRVLSPRRDDASVFLATVPGARQKRVVPPAEVADTLTRRFPFDLNTEQFFTLVYGILNCRDGSFRYVCAGHPGPAWVPRHGAPQILKGAGLPIGVGDVAYTEHTVRLSPGDRLYLYTDGLTDAMNAAGELYGASRVLGSLSLARAGSLQESLTDLLADAKAWRVRARDDVSLVALEWTGAARRNSPRQPRRQTDALTAG